MTTPQEILDYWYGPDTAPHDVEARKKIWWQKNEDVDREIGERFAATLAASARGELADWSATPDGRLAHIILIDQMARNMHRDSPGMYAQDDLAQELALIAYRERDEEGRDFARAHFTFMPLMHAENVALQRLCCRIFRDIAQHGSAEHQEAAEMVVDFADRHRVIVERFGRFPHRNDILGRVSTPEEVEFLKEPGSSF